MLKIGFIGTGNVASAILGGIVPAGLAKPHNIYCHDVDPERLWAARKIAAFETCKSNVDVVRETEVIFLCVKPKNVRDVMEEIKNDITSRHLIISVCAGIKTSFIEGIAGDDVRVVRVMPNTPALIKCGASALAKGEFATEEDLALALSVFNVIGVAVEVDESDLDAVTGLSGSGPAYVFYMTECLVRAGVKVGLSPEIAEKLTKFMVLGAARMIVERDESLKRLREMVTTPGGTTEAGLKIMSEHDFEKMIEQVVTRATERSRELGAGQKPPSSGEKTDE